MSATKTKLRIGNYEICPIPTGIFGLDGGAMFGTVPKVLWEKSIPPDVKNRIPMEARALLLKGSGRNILIDVGNGGDFVAKYGDKLGSKFAELYNVKEGGVSLLSSLERNGLKPDDVTDVILTHLHFDHAGGSTQNHDGKIVPTFPKAKYHVQRRNLETAKNPNVREKASYFAINFEPLIERGQLNIIDGAREELLPGISVLISDGHTQGQQMVKISDGQKTLLYCGDVIPTSAHVRLAWVMGYDLRPLDLIEEKKKVLSLAADQGWYLYFEHDPYIDAALVQRQGEDFAVKERITL